MTRPRILVLMAAFNGSAWIREQLDSILAQIDVKVSIIVSDDCSTDDTRTRVSNYVRSDSVVLVSRTVPTGSAAQNFVSLIRENDAFGFDYVAFSDQDDVWNKDKLFRACRALTGTCFVGYSSAVTATWSNRSERVLKQEAASTPSDFLFEGAGQGCTFVLRADFYGRVRDFLVAHKALTKNLHYHDWAIYALARSWDLPWTFDPRTSMMYRQHESNDTGARRSLRGIAKRFTLIKKGWYSVQLFAIAELCFAAAPTNKNIEAWHSILLAPPGFRRRLQIVRYCLRGGRRRRRDTTILIFAALAGWI